MKNIEAERAVLGAILLEPPALAQIREMLEPEFFALRSHREIFRAMIAIVDRGEPLDPEITLPKELERRGQLDRIGGKSYLAELFGTVATAANIKFHAGLVLEAYKGRKARTIGQKLVQASERAPDSETLIVEAIAELEGLRTRKPAGRFVFTAQELWETDVEKPSVLLGTEAWPLLTKGQVMLIGGHTGVGKTTALHNLGFCLASEQVAFGLWRGEGPFRIFYLHTEASREYLWPLKVMMERMLDDRERFRGDRGKVGENFAFRIGAELTDGVVLDLTRKDHRTRIIREASDFGADLVIVDPLRLVVGNRDENAAQEVTTIHTALRDLAHRIDAAVIAVTHLNKANRIPGSYVWEALADVVWEIHDLQAAGHPKGNVGVYSLKNRNGDPPDGRRSWWWVLDFASLWFEARPEKPPEREELYVERRGRKPEYDPAEVAEVLRTEGEMGRRELKEAVIQRTSCGDGTANRLIQQALQKKLIMKERGVYKVREAMIAPLFDLEGP